LLENIIAVFSKYHMAFFEGLRLTLVLSAFTVGFGTLFGALVSLCKMSKFKLPSFLATAYIEVIRGTPLLLQVYVFYFFVPKAMGFDPGKFASILMALVVNSTAYISEIIRAGIQAVDKGQTEAARSLGLNTNQTMIRIILPQAFKNILPALGNEFIMIMKETSLASVFFLGEIMTATNIIKSATYMTLEPYLIAAVFYFVSTFTLSKLLAFLERRLKTSD